MSILHGQVIILILLGVITSKVITHVEEAYECRGMNVVLRSDWGSYMVARNKKFENAPARLFIHHTASNSCRTMDQCKDQVRKTQENDIKRLGHPDISFHFLIGGDGRIYEGLGWERMGDHTKYYPYTIGVAFIGRFDKSRPPETAWRALSSLMTCGVKFNKLQTPYSVHTHRDVTCTTCPGESLHKLTRSLRAYNRFPLPYIDLCKFKPK